MSSAPSTSVSTKHQLVMPTHEFDEIDLRILTALQRDGRMSNIDIAQIAQITAPPTLRRTRTLEDKGIIRGYRAEIDARKLGFEVLAFVFVGLASQSNRDIKAFEQTVQLWPAVRECYSLSGETDFLLKCIAKNLTELQSFVTNTVMTSPGVRSVRTAFSSHVVKNEPTVPLSQVAAPPPLGAARKLRLQQHSR